MAGGGRTWAFWVWYRAKGWPNDMRINKLRSMALYRRSQPPRLLVGGLTLAIVASAACGGSDDVVDNTMRLSFEGTVSNANTLALPDIGR